MGKLTSTHTVVELQVSRAVYDEIAGKFRDAQYNHVFFKEGDKEMMDMSGIALTVDPDSQ